jgi:hypothetical protein
MLQNGYFHACAKMDGKRIRRLRNIPIEETLFANRKTKEKNDPSN